MNIIDIEFSFCDKFSKKPTFQKINTHMLKNIIFSSKHAEILK